MLGVMPTQQAMDLANEKKLDLVNISPNAKVSLRASKERKRSQEETEDDSSERDQTEHFH